MSTKEWKSPITTDSTDWTSVPGPVDFKYEIRETAVRPVEQRIYCECGGEMKSTGMIRGWSAIHRCGHCHLEVGMAEKYPRVIHVPLDSPPEG
jgi:hypothetical protein